MTALEEFVRQAMAAGAACFVERYARGEIDPADSMTDTLGDFPAEFIQIRSELINDLRREWGVS